MKIRAAIVRAAVPIVLAAAMAGCSKSPDSAWWNSSSPTAPTGTIAGLVLQPRSLEGGVGGNGTITLAQPSSGASTVTLSSSDPSVTLPGTLTIAAGATSAAFPIATSAVNSDRVVVITASLSGSSYKAPLTVWQVSPNSVWYEITPNGAAHFTAGNSTFRASCTSGAVDVRVGDPEWDITFIAVDGRPIQPGVYENVGSGRSSSRPGLLIFPFPFTTVCPVTDVTGRFVIEEADLPQRGPVRRFVASFEQRCTNGAASIRGEVRLTDPSPSIIISPGLVGCTP